MLGHWGRFKLAPIATLACLQSVDGLAAQGHAAGMSAPAWRISMADERERAGSAEPTCTIAQPGFQVRLNRSGRVKLGFTDRRSLLDPRVDDVDDIDLISVQADRRTWAANYEQTDGPRRNSAANVAGPGEITFGGGYVSLRERAGVSMPAETFLSAMFDSESLTMRYRGHAGVTTTIVEMRGLQSSVAECQRMLR